MVQWTAFMRKYISACSQHMKKRNVDYKLSKADIRDVIPNYDQLVEQAEAAGRRTCHNCNFMHYRTTDRCPKCGTLQVT
jgi:rubrerythrin